MSEQRMGHPSPSFYDQPPLTDEELDELIATTEEGPVLKGLIQLRAIRQEREWHLSANGEFKVENDHLRELLNRAHDAMVTVMNDIVTTRGRIATEKHRRRYRAAGSCVVCGAEAQKDRSRCLDCARKNSEIVKRRRREKAA